MKRLLALTAFILVMGLSASANVVLNDWCVNVNSDITTACNLAGSGGGAINMSGFDTTLGPNTLGTIQVTLGTGLNQSASVYMDYDLDYSATGSFQDSGSANGTLPGGVSYELADPNSGTLFSDFAANTLGNSNTVGTYSGPPSPCCDVAWALGVGGIDVAAGQTAVVTFSVSTVAPTSGFYLQQTNGQKLDSIYLTESVQITGGGGGGNVPEPQSFFPALILFGAVFFLARKKQLRLS